MTYPGGKNGAGVYQTIINQLPPHDVYIEPFLGGGAIMRQKLPAVTANIGVDRSSSAIAEFADASGVTAIVGDGIQYLADYKFRGRELVYCDPPYLRETRKCARDLYEYEMTDADHWQLLALLLELPCNVAISGYWSKFYADALADWRLVTFTAQTRRGPATECLWMNYPEPTALHDSRFLGGDFRERERIKRKVARWSGKFAKLPELERRGILSSLLAVSDTASPKSTSGDSGNVEGGGDAWEIENERGV